jgi:beta-glucuronidase
MFLLLISSDVDVTQEYSFDFFNYAGIHRSVILYTTPPVFLSDITIATDYLFDTGIVKFTAEVGANDDVTRRDITMLYELLDKEGRMVATVGGTQLFHGELRVRRPSLWWPVGMGYQPGYLYTLKVLNL